MGWIAYRCETCGCCPSQHVAEGGPCRAHWGCEKFVEELFWVRSNHPAHPPRQLVFTFWIPEWLKTSEWHKA